MMFLVPSPFCEDNSAAAVAARHGLTGDRTPNFQILERWTAPGQLSWTTGLGSTGLKLHPLVIIDTVHEFPTYNSGGGPQPMDANRIPTRWVSRGASNCVTNADRPNLQACHGRLGASESLHPPFIWSCYGRLDRQPPPRWVIVVLACFEWSLFLLSASPL